MGTGINNSYSINLNIGCPKKNTLKIVLFTNKYIDLESNNINYYYYYRTYNFVI